MIKALIMKEGEGIYKHPGHEMCPGQRSRKGRKDSSLFAIR